VKDFHKCGDTELVCMTLSGDRDAYDELVSRYKNMVYGIAYRIISEHYAAEDIAQDAFVDGYMQLSRLNEPEKFAPWIYGIVKRKALHYITRRRIHADIDDMAEILYADAASPEDEFIQKERSSAVRAAISSLSYKNREVAVMFYFGNLSISEIAKRLSLPQGTVKSRLYEARAKLKGELAYMRETNQGLSPDFEVAVREKITKLKLYYKESGYDESYEKLYTDTEQYITTQPESCAKQAALADLYLEKFWHNKKDETLETKLRNSAEAGKNGMVLCDLFIEDIIKGSDHAGWIKRLDEEAIPKMEQMHCNEGKGQMLFWRGAAYINLRRMDEAIADFTEAKRLCPDRNIYNTLAVTALKIHDKLTANADDPFIGFDVTAESYQKVGTKVIFTGQPGFSGKNDAMWEKHKMKYINYFVSRFDNTFFDTSMETGKTYTSKNGNSTLTLLGYDEAVTVAAGTFERCMHLFYSAPIDYDADIWYADGIGLVKAVFSGKRTDGEEYVLAGYDIKGGEGYFPFCTGNRWRYVKPDLQDYLYQCFENEVIWTDGESANVSTVHSVAFKKNYLTDCRLDSDIYISQCNKICDEWKLDEAIKLLQKAVRENSSQNAAMAALGGIEYLSCFAEYQKKGYRFCPSSYNASYLLSKDGCVMYDEAGAYSFGPYRWGSRFEENRIFGVKSFRYLQDLTGRIWDDKWIPGYSEKLREDDWGADIFIAVSDGGTVTTKAGTFGGCVKITLDVEMPNMKPDYYFDGYRYVWCGKKEFWFVRGVGIVRFDYTWGDCLKSSSELASFANPTADDSYMPLSLGSGWEYDEMKLTSEGYRAKHIFKVACGMNEKYLIHDMQEFLYLGTEDEYEAFKAKLTAGK
jgi:RNA polymerase sigma factor (sigma-70 family)